MPGSAQSCSADFLQHKSKETATATESQTSQIKRRENMKAERSKIAGFVDQGKLSLVKLLTDIQPEAKLNCV